MNAPGPEERAEEAIRIGRLNGAWGVSGWVKVFSFTDPPENIFDYQPWQAEGLPGLLHVSEWRRQGPRLVARFHEIDTREAAERLNGVDLWIEPDALPAPGREQYYWKDLLGLRVVNLESVELGKVHGLLDAGAHDVLVIRRTDKGQDHLVPFVPEAYVHDVDFDAGTIRVDWQADWTDAD